MKPLALFVGLPLFCVLSACGSHEDPRPAAPQSFTTENVTSASFAAYVHSYTEPRFLDKNSVALDARLKLLDAAPKGAHARIATFEFINGTATRTFARHVCLAAQRGVKVELLVDSKNGDRPGSPDAFDTTDDAQVVEELFQYMANCGAHVMIYNHIDDWISIFGVRLPNIYGDPSLNRKAVDPISLIAHIDMLIDRVARIANEELARGGIKADFKPLLKNFRSLGLEIVQLASVTASARNDEQAPFGFDATVATLTNRYHDLLADPVWDKVPPAVLRPALSRFVARLENDPAMKPVYAALNRYNRVQHRKIFIVENESDGCILLGGRNLGDAYLTDVPTSFLDGDVFLCRNHGADASRGVDEAIASFENLRSDRSGKSADLEIRDVTPDSSYPFANLAFPAGLAPPGLVVAPYEGKLPFEKRTLLRERTWHDTSPVLGDVGLGSGRNWHVYLSSWNPADDQVRAELLRKIGAESKEIYIETAYAQFDPGVRAAIEAALARGVRVRLVTNSFFVTDGMSKAIRALMAHWTDETRHRYPGLFTVALTSYQSGHMIHFKSASFACQHDASGETVRSYIVGSHNFHPRSGRSDKENSLMWDEPTNCESRVSEGLVQHREEFYGGLGRALHAPALVDYPSFHAELAAASLERESHPGDVSTRWVSIALRRMFFEENATRVVPREQARVEKVMGVADKGGLTDLLGLLL
jgi:phosphatidylserine/phosphatidylglycerophosphate/cardiolipin synthase-like enzyme